MSSHLRTIVLAALVFCSGVALNAQVKLNEIFAENQHVTYKGVVSDLVELINTSAGTIDLSTYSLSDTATNQTRWRFPAGSSIAANGYLVVLLDGSNPASTSATTPLNSGFSIKGSGDNLYLFNNGAVADSLTFGVQVADLSLGRVPDGSGSWVLTTPSPNVSNSAIALADFSGLRVNEWMASPSSGDDWFEIYNSAAAPVSLAGLYLTDTSAVPKQFTIAPLSFIGSGYDGYVRFWASGSTNKGADHTNFKLSGSGEAIGIYSPRVTQIDYQTFGAQATDISQGRLPDGSATIVSFGTVSDPAAATPTPGAPNFVRFPGLIVNELLSHTDPPLEDAVEFYNQTDSAIDISGWFLTNKRSEPKKYQVPANSVIPAKGYFVFYESQFNGPSAAKPFTFNSAHGDEVYLSQAINGQLTGYVVSEIFEAAENGFSFGHYQTSVPNDYKFVAMSHRSFGADDPATIAEFERGKGAPNPAPLVGPVVISELMYHPLSSQPGVDNTLDEYVELQNITSSAVPLYDPLHSTNHWRLQNGLAFTFPAGASIPALGTVLVVSFDPVQSPATLSAFRAKFNVPGQVAIFGPYDGKLDNGGDPVEIYKPDPPQLPPHPDVGFVPYIRVDKVNYLDAAPWPTAADGTGKSLQRKNLKAFGNDPINWEAADPTAGRQNSAAIADNDADGIPDAWETANGLNPNDASDAALDPDGDGMTNLQEYIAGTDPHVKTSVLKIDQIIPTLSTATPLKIRFTAAANKSYSVQYRNSMAPASLWQKLADVPAGAGGAIEVTDANTVGKTDRYYRIITPAAD